MMYGKNMIITTYLNPYAIKLKAQILKPSNGTYNKVYTGVIIIFKQ